MNDNTALLERMARMWQRNWEMVKEQWEIDQTFDKDLLREMKLLWCRMEELIPDSHLDQINEAVYNSKGPGGPY